MITHTTNDFKVGDFVEVLPHYFDGESGLRPDISYPASMRQFVGKVFEVESIAVTTVNLTNGFSYLPEHLRLYTGTTQAVDGPVESDGGSSSYYQIDIPVGMLARWNNTGKIEAKDVMKLFLDNDYNFSNSFKAHARVVSLRRGIGKAGISERYDLKKAVFFGQDALDDYDENNPTSTDYK